jgi:PEP-CTERM motif
VKRLLWVSPILLLVLSVSAVADSVTITLSPGIPDESNFRFVARQGGIYANLAGTVPESFYSTSLIPPGSTLGGTSEVFVDGGLIKINGVSYDDLGLDIGSLFVSTFTFPTNGKDFTTPIQASFSVTELIVVTGEYINISGTASGKVTFHYISNVGLYSPTKIFLTTVPEPTTLGLLGTGLVGIFAFAGKELKRTH